MEQESHSLFLETADFRFKVELTISIDSQVIELWKMNLLAATQKYIFVGCRHKVCVYSHPPALCQLTRLLHIPKGPDPTSSQSVNCIKLLQVAGEEVLGVATFDAQILLYSVTDLGRAPIALNNYSPAYPDNSTWSLDASGDWVVAGSNSRTISCWNLVTGEFKRSEVHEHNIPCVKCVPGTNLVLTASIDRTFRISTLEGELVEQGAPGYSWGWFITSIPRNSVNLSARGPLKLNLEPREYISLQVNEPENVTLTIRQRGTVVDDEQLQQCGLLLYATAKTLYLIDPTVNLQQDMHVLSEYVPITASHSNRRGCLNMVEYIPEWGVCLFASQFKPYVSVAQFTKSLVQGTQQFIYFIEPVTNIRVRGRVLGLTIKNCVAWSNMVWVYVLTARAAVTAFSLSKRDELGSVTL